MLGRRDFPKGFVWGTATSAYQIEGHAAGGAGRTHWDDFAATPGNVAGAQDGALACDHLHRWEGDLDLVAGANLDAYRFSTSWARVLPEGRGAANEAGLDFYDRLVDGCLARGLKPMATLYHWELPSALADLGGWRNADMPGWFAEFTETVMRRIGDRVWAAAPINEPWCVAWLSHFDGVHAPGLRDLRATARAMHHVLVAHGASIDAMRALGMGNLGAVCNFEWTQPADESPEAARAAAAHHATYNRWFVGGLFRRAYPAEALEGLEPHLPAGWEDDFDRIARPLDWVGVNYYTTARIAAAPGPWPAMAAVDPRPPVTQMGWEVHPAGLGEVLRLVHDHAGGLPIYVTENGMACDDRPGEPDQARIDYIDRHLRVAHAALEEGVPLAGYFVWSLMDNYEWAEGYAKRFGLVHVDFETLARTPKASWHALRDALGREPA
jgi:beta-glucosidase